MKANFSYILLYLGGIGYSPAETIARNFPDVSVELGQFRNQNFDGRFIGTIESDTVQDIDLCLDSLGAFGVEKLPGNSVMSILQRNLPDGTVIDVTDGQITVTYEENNGSK